MSNHDDNSAQVKPHAKRRAGTSSATSVGDLPRSDRGIHLVAFEEPDVSRLHPPPGSLTCQQQLEQDHVFPLLYIQVSNQALLA